jgi:hypothetical protein
MGYAHSRDVGICVLGGESVNLVDSPASNFKRGQLLTRLGILTLEPLSWNDLSALLACGANGTTHDVLFGFSDSGAFDVACLTQLCRNYEWFAPLLRYVRYQVLLVS